MVVNDPGAAVAGDSLGDARHGFEPGRALAGRDREIAEALERLSAGRVLTLVGEPGIGKTALALAVADAASDRYSDVWYCGLAAAHDAPSMTAELGRTIGALPNEDVEPLDAVVGALDGRRALVVLDHLDEIAGAAAGVVARLLSNCRGLTLVATARVALGIGDEDTMEIGPLAAGSGGHPLAAELTESLRTDPEPSDDVLAAALAAASERLDPVERRLFERVSVFRGSFDEGAARAVLGSDAAVHDVARLLDRLAEASLLRRAGAARWWMLEAVRQHGDRRLAAREERAAVRNTHVDLLVDRTASAAAACAGGGWSTGLADFRSSWPDLRAAVQWSIDAQRSTDVDVLLRQCYFVARWTLEAEPATWAQRALGRVDATGVGVGAPVHLHDAFGASLAGDRERALAAGQRAIDALDATPADRSWARLDGALGLVALGRVDRAAAMADDMVRDIPPRAVEQAIQGAAHPVVKVWARQMPLDDALDSAERARLVAEATRSPVAIGLVEYYRGLLAIAGRDAVGAVDSFRRVLDIGRSNDVAQLVAAVLPSLVGTPGRDGLVAASEAMERGRASAAVGHEFVVLEGSGINLAELGHLDAAAVVLGHLEPGGRRSSATRERRDTAMHSLGGQRRTRRLMDKGAAMSRAEVWEYTEDQLRRVLAAR